MYMSNKTYKDKNGGEFTVIGNGNEKVTVYKSASGRTATFKDKKKLDRKSK